MSFFLEWIGHSCFLLKTPECCIIIDPFLDSNARTRKTVEFMENVDLILLTHGHFDHVSEAIPLSEKTGAPLVAAPELSHLLKQVQPSLKIFSIGIGGAINPQKEWGWKNISSIKMVSALHSSSFELKGIRHYAGLAGGFLITLEIGSKQVRLYHAGDTALHTDMQLLHDFVDIAMLPVDGRYNMSWEDVKIFDHWVSPKILVPMHYNTFPEIQLHASLIEEMRSHKKVQLFDEEHYSLSLS